MTTSFVNVSFVLSLNGGYQPVPTLTYPGQAAGYSGAVPYRPPASGYPGYPGLPRMPTPQPVSYMYPSLVVTQQQQSQPQFSSPPAPPTTSKKHKDFVNSPMGPKPVTDLPGIGPVLGRMLNEAGIFMASEVYGRYLTMQRDNEEFIRWLRAKTGARNNCHVRKCCNGLDGYYMNFMA